QLKLWRTSGTVVERRPPKMIAEIGTPCGSFALGESAGLFVMGAVKRLLGCAALSAEPRFQGRPCQSMSSHQTSPSFVIATLVKSVFLCTDAIAFAFDLRLVPGATPKYPASGLIAHRRPSSPTRIQAMSSPTVHTFQPLNAGGGISIAKFVLPHALGNAAATYVVSPCGLSTPRISMCSASQPSCRPR